MNSQRKRIIMYMMIAAVAYTINYFFGRDVLTFIARHVVYWLVSLACAGTFAYFLVNLIWGNESSSKNDDAEKCPYYVEPRNKEV